MSHKKVIRKLPPLHALKAFEVVGYYGSFTLAAEAMNLTPSALSHQVRQLEASLQVELFQREYHKLLLTPVGRGLLPVLRTAFDDIRRAVQNINEEGDLLSSLQLNLPPTFAARWFMPRLADLRQVFPMADIRVTTYSQDGLPATHHELDCAVRYGDGEWPDVDTTFLMREKLVAVCAPNLIQRAAGNLKVILEDNTLLHLVRGGSRYMAWDRWLTQANIHGVDASHGMAFDTQDMALAAARSGLGIVMADERMIEQDLLDGQLVKLNDVAVEGASYWFVTGQGESQKSHLIEFRNWLFSHINSSMDVSDTDISNRAFQASNSNRSSANQRMSDQIASVNNVMNQFGLN